MKAMIQAVMNEIQAEAATTKKVLDALPEDKYSWKPHEKSMTAGRLVTHMSTFPKGLFGAISAPFLDVSNVRESTDAPLSKSEALRSFDDGIRMTCQGLSDMSEAQASEMWAFKRGSETLGEMPRLSAVKTLILNHLIHHRGQLSVYLRLLDQPVPSIYGPSADVNPFA